jgi:hypothetical protein
LKGQAVLRLIDKIYGIRGNNILSALNLEWKIWIGELGRIAMSENAF